MRVSGEIPNLKDFTLTDIVSRGPLINLLGPLKILISISKEIIRCL